MAATFKQWPNRLGIDVHVDDLQIEIWEHGGIRVNKEDPSVCTGYTPMVWARVPRADLETMARAALDLWRQHPEQFQECE